MRQYLLALAATCAAGVPSKAEVRIELEVDALVPSERSVFVETHRRNQ